MSETRTDLPNGDFEIKSGIQKAWLIMWHKKFSIHFDNRINIYKDFDGFLGYQEIEIDMNKFRKD